MTCNYLVRDLRSSATTANGRAPRQRPRPGHGGTSSMSDSSSQLVTRKLERTSTPGIFRRGEPAMSSSSATRPGGSGSGGPHPHRGTLAQVEPDDGRGERRVPRQSNVTFADYWPQWIDTLQRPGQHEGSARTPAPSTAAILNGKRPPTSAGCAWPRLSHSTSSVGFPASQHAGSHSPRSAAPSHRSGRCSPMPPRKARSATTRPQVFASPRREGPGAEAKGTHRRRGESPSGSAYERSATGCSWTSCSSPDSGSRRPSRLTSAT